MSTLEAIYRRDHGRKRDGNKFPRAIITPQQTRILELLVKRGSVHRDQIFAMLYGDDPNGGPDHPTRTLSVQMFKMRRRLLSYNIHIETVATWGDGATYHLTGEDRERARDFLATRECLAISRAYNQLELFTHG